MLKNIIFDFGGVIIPINYSKTIDAFEQLGAKDVVQYFSQLSQVELFDRLDKGAISNVDFRTHFNQLFNLNLPVKDFDAAWNAMLLDIPNSHIAFLQQLKERYNLYLLSNTNRIHIDAINAYLKTAHNIDDWKSYFTKVYYSFDIGMRKPDEDIFRKVINENQLNLSETLYIEDNDKNLEAAQQIGLPAYTYPMNADLPTELNFLLNKTFQSKYL